MNLFGIQLIIADTFASIPSGLQGIHNLVLGCINLFHVELPVTEKLGSAPRGHHELSSLVPS